MNKIKNIIYGIIASVIVMPGLAFAQLNTGEIEGSSQLSSTPISEIIINLMQWLLYMVGFLAVIGFVIAGILYLTSAGDDTQISRAKTTMINSIIGILVALLGLIIITAVRAMLGGSNNTF